VNKQKKARKRRVGSGIFLVTNITHKSQHKLDAAMLANADALC
jgi:hypothetical protein